ncbi:SulP family inorganic anion transporter [Tepidimonas taiwanensis]|uniref:SulP family inorganic anion transporter n=1 Tax=Tepidimonas taiwanensis TaxID=307486 RepID=UPI0007347A4D|nr:SulP family inorganic anion transporter [Tepidimonas taiwanensis]
MAASAWSDWFPVLRWARGYGRGQLGGDLTAAAVVTLLLIPQALAYAVLAGMPPVTGLYASIVPMAVYALMCSSNVLGPGPTALRSVMSAAAVGAVVAPGGDAFIATSAVLAVLVGVALLVMGALRMGFMAHFLSQPVLAGFITAGGLLIAMSQVGHLLGVPLASGDALAFAHSLIARAGDAHGLTLAGGVASIVAMAVTRRWGRTALTRLAIPAGVADVLVKATPLLVMAAAIGAAQAFDAPARGVAVVGDIPRGLPGLSVAPLLTVPWTTVQALLLPALLIAAMTFVEQISIAQSMAARRGERLDANAEMRAMGAANVAAGLTGAFAIGASFARTTVVADSGGRTPAAGLYTAVLLALAALLLTPWLRALPMAVLAAVVLVSLGSLLDWASFRRNWHYSRADFAAQALTFVATLLVDLVSGLMVGVLASLALHLWRSSHPHIAVVGNVAGTEHYRNVARHDVVTHPHLLGLRVDESLFFANVHHLEERIDAELAAQPAIRDVILQCTAVNDIDASALQVLTALNDRLRQRGVRLHLSEVKGPVMDRLRRSDFLQRLSGHVYLTHHQAVQALRTSPPGA